MADPNINQTNAQIRQDALQTASIVEEALRSIADSVSTAFENALGTTNNVSQAVAKDLQKSFNTLGKISKETASNITKLQDGLLKSKAVQEQINKRKQEELAAGLSLATALKAQGAALASIDDLVDRTTGELKDQEAAYQNLDDTQKSIVQQYAEALRYSQEQTAELEKQKQQAKDIEDARDKSLGISGKLLKTLGGIKGLGDSIKKSQEELNEYAEDYRKKNGEYPSQMQSLGKAITLTGKSFVKGLLDPAVLLGSAVSLLIKGFFDSDKATTGLQKNLTISKEEALALNREFTAATTNLDNMFISSRDMIKSFGVLQDTLGSVGTVSTQTAETFARLNKLVGLTEQEAAGLTAQADAFGKNSDEVYSTQLRTTHQVSQQYKTQINQKAVLAEVGKASAYTLVQFRGSTQALTEAVAKSKALGLSLETLGKISSGLLDFQSSIENELAAELLTGKQINLEQARYYALTNQQSKLMDELNSQIGTFSDYSNMNVVQQEAYAKSLGMSSNELSEMLFKQEYRGKTEKEIANIADEDLRKRVEALSIQDKFQAATEKLSATFADFVAGPIGSLLTNVKVISGIIGFMAGSQLGKLATAFAPVISAAATYLGITTATAAGATATATAVSFGAMLPVILGGVGALLAVLAASNADDLFSPKQGGSGYGKRTLLAPEGAYKLNDNDNIIATTNPINANDLIAGPKGSIKVQQQAVSTQPVKNEISIAPANTQINLNLNGAAIGNANARQSYGIGKGAKAFGGMVDYSAPI